MLERSYISDKKISKSMTKLNRISSDKKFRVKSLRLKTQEKTLFTQSPLKKSLNFPSILKFDQLPYQSPTKHITSLDSDIPSILINSKLRIKSSLLQKDYQQQLVTRLNIPKTIVQQLFRLKLQNQQIKATQQKYLQFCKILFLRLIDKVQISLQGFNLKNKALERFLQFFIEWNNPNIISVDLSLCSEISYQIKNKQQQEQNIANGNSRKNITQQNQEQALWPKGSILTRIVLEAQRLMKLSVRNMHINPQQMVDLLTQCLLSKRIYSLDISNKNSQAINRLGTQYFYLQAFFAKNQYIGVMKMDNLNITDQCIQKMSHGIGKNLSYSPLKILSLGGNLLTEKSLYPIYNIMTKAGLTELNLSNNPLSRQFFIQIKNLRSNTVKSLDLSSTGMDSQSLIHFLQQISENKVLQILKLDNNDFSYHWFNKIKDLFEQGLSIQSLSMVNCSIRNFDNLFEGLIYSKYLRRLNLNYNLVDVQNENIDKLQNCLRNNNALEQLKIRFCGYNENMLCQLIQALRRNHALQVFDISENHMSDKGGKVILKMLSENRSIKDMGIQKLQFTVKMTEQIQNCINFNRQLRQKQQFVQLIDDNKVYKSKDILSWTDIYRLQQQANKLQKQVLQYRNRNQKIQTKIIKKKQNFIQLKKQSKLSQKIYDKQLKNQQIKINKLLKLTHLQIQKTSSKLQQSIQQFQIETNLIKALENKICKENQKIKKRQNQLEDQLRDQKYLQKRKQKIQKQKMNIIQSTKPQYQKSIKSKNSTQIFDNMKGINNLSKRKSSTINKKT